MADRSPTSADVIDFFGDRVICSRCNATVSTYGDTCTAPLNERCPGFTAYDDLLGLVRTAMKDGANG